MSYVQVCETHANRLQDAIIDTSHLVPFTIDNISTLNKLDAALLEVITSRFAKLQDTCGQKIFPLVLTCSGEDVADKTFVDILIPGILNTIVWLTTLLLTQNKEEELHAKQWIKEVGILNEFKSGKNWLLFIGLTLLSGLILFGPSLVLG